MKNSLKIAIITIIVTVIIGGVYLFSRNNINPDDNIVACTMEAKICPDGSAVGRNGPKCEFTACPTIKESAKAKVVEKILNNGVYITPQDVVEDSRCPEDVTCIWAGQVKLRVTLRLAGDNPIDEKDVTLTMGVATPFKGKEIELINVTPVPNSKKSINAGDYAFTFRVTTITSQGTLKGTVTTSPTCPVERMPPDPACAPRPYTTSIHIRQEGKQTIITTIPSDNIGFFKTDLPAGSYTLEAITASGSILPRCSPVTVLIKSGQTSTVDISCDSGIR